MQQQNRKLLLTILIPAYNVQDYIIELLSSIYGSGVDDSKFELLIVDDGATDSTIERVQTSLYGAKQNLRIICKNNGGHGSCINTAINVSDGLYFRIIDGDDWVDSKNFYNYIERLEKSGADLIVDSYSKYYVATKKYEKMSELFDIVGDYFGQSEKVLSVLKNDYILLPMITIKTDLYRGMKSLIDEHISYDDAEYNTLCVMAANTIEVIDSNVYQYRIGRPGQSVAPNVLIKRISNLEMVINYVLDKIEENKITLSNTKREYLERYISKTAYNCICICISQKGLNRKKYQEIRKIDNLIKEKNINVYKLMENEKMYGKKIRYFRRYGLLFCYIYPLVFRS